MTKSQWSDDIDSVREYFAVRPDLHDEHFKYARLLQSNEIEAELPFRTVGVIGGGTAGYLAALAFKKKFPRLDVTLIESKSIPIIGVGEATTPGLISFLHGLLGFDVLDFYQHVKPTWKQGIRFDWGKPGTYFNAPFDWGSGSPGLFRAMRQGTPHLGTIQSFFMDENTVPVFVKDDAPLSLMPYIPFAYHLDNERFVSYLHQRATSFGVRQIEATLTSAKLTEDGERVAGVIADDGREFQYDLYIDCSGFRSFLLEKQLRSKFISYASSLFADTAIPFNIPHGGRLKGYTTATTMNHGWCWNIPQVEDDHCGYVFSSAFASVDQALVEIEQRFDYTGSHRVIKFPSGRHEHFWKGNVIAMGNAYGFVEPLESTAIYMVIREISATLALLAQGYDLELTRDTLNQSLGNDWDHLRWFLAIHYKFNRRLDTEFWKAVRADVDVSGIEPSLRVYEKGGPLSFQPRRMQEELYEHGGLFRYFGGAVSFDTIMLGQSVDTRALPLLEMSNWQSMADKYRDLARQGLREEDALQIMTRNPDLLQQIVQGGRGHWMDWMLSGLLEGDLPI